MPQVNEFNLGMQNISIFLEPIQQKPELLLFAIFTKYSNGGLKIVLIGVLWVYMPSLMEISLKLIFIHHWVV